MMSQPAADGAPSSRRCERRGQPSATEVRPLEMVRLRPTGAAPAVLRRLGNASLLSQLPPPPPPSPSRSSSPVASLVCGFTRPRDAPRHPIPTQNQPVPRRSPWSLSFRVTRSGLGRCGRATSGGRRSRGLWEVLDPPNRVGSGVGCRLVNARRVSELGRDKSFLLFLPETPVCFVDFGSGMWKSVL